MGTQCKSTENKSRRRRHGWPRVSACPSKSSSSQCNLQLQIIRPFGYIFSTSFYCWYNSTQPFSLSAAAAAGPQQKKKNEQTATEHQLRTMLGRNNLHRFFARRFVVNPLKGGHGTRRREEEPLKSHRTIKCRVRREETNVKEDPLLEINVSLLVIPPVNFYDQNNDNNLRQTLN